MKVHSLFILLFCGYALCNLVSNVRLIDHISYVINMITRTVNIVEERGWCNLKLPDYNQRINATLLTSPYRANLGYTNGFVSSIQHVDITVNSVQQVWLFNASAPSTHTVALRGTLRMHNLAVGYDVTGHLESDTTEYHYTAVYVHPLVSFDFSLTKDLLTSVLTMTVVGNVPATTLAPAFQPRDNISDIFASAFDATEITAAGIRAWGPEVFQPITSQLVYQEIGFPDMCFNC